MFDACPDFIQLPEYKSTYKLQQTYKQLRTLDRSYNQATHTKTLQPQSIMKVKIKKWNAVATWRWDLPEDDVCGICQVHFDGTCPTCKYPGDDCSLRGWFLMKVYTANHDANTFLFSVSGKCGHNFHMVS